MTDPPRPLTRRTESVWRRRDCRRHTEPLSSAPMLETIDRAVAYIRSRSKIQPQVGVVLGSGLGNVMSGVDVETEIPYGDIPGAKASTVVGHSGKMILGRVG